MHWMRYHNTRLFIVALPGLFMCCGVVWLFVVVTLLKSRQNGQPGNIRRRFSQMSIGVGLAFIVWAIAVMIASTIKIAYPLLMAFVGLLLIVQGWMFTKL